MIFQKAELKYDSSLTNRTRQNIVKSQIQHNSAQFDTIRAKFTNVKISRHFVLEFMPNVSRILFECEQMCAKYNTRDILYYAVIRRTRMGNRTIMGHHIMMRCFIMMRCPIVYANFQNSTKSFLPSVQSVQHAIEKFIKIVSEPI